MNDSRRHLQRHQLAVRRKRYVTRVEGDAAAEPKNRLQGRDVPKAELITSRNNQRPAIGREEYIRSLAENPFVDHFTSDDIPQPDPVRVPATARCPAAIPAERADLAIFVP